MLRHILFAATLVSMTVYLSCKGKIDGPVGGVDYDPQIPEPPELVIEDKTDELVAPDITVNEGTVGNQAAEDLANETIEPADSVELASTAAALEEAISEDAQTYWTSNKDNLDDLATGEDATFTTQVKNAEAKLAANQELLAKYLPDVVAASGGRIIMSGARVGYVDAIYNDNIARTSNDLCKNTWIQWRDDQLGAYQAVLDASLATIQGAYDAQLGILNTNRDSKSASFLANRNANVTKWINLQNSASTKIEEARAAGIISDETFSLLENLNAIMAGVNLYYTQANFNAANAALATAYENGLESLDSKKEELDGSATDAYNELASDVISEYNENVAKCHDQGGTHQGTNG